MKPGLIRSQVFDVVQKTLDYIAESLAKGDKVELRNFGVFEVQNPQGPRGPATLTNPRPMSPSPPARW